MIKETVPIQYDDNGEAFITLSDEICKEAGLSVGDAVEWIDNKDGSWTVKKYDRFDLEAAITSAWVVIDLMQEEAEATGNEYLKGLATVYDKQFQKLWDGFEAMVANKEFK